ncbi:MAG: PAC2 family protein [Actinobacteria bacterium]|nr:PAC2 family protein [Actinomycetota bacterium]
MTLHRVTGSLDGLVSPVLVAAFDGWIDAAGAATGCANQLALGGDTVIEFDSDILTDYRSRRPVLDVIDGVLNEVAWPQLSIRRRRVGERDLLVLVGPEPDFRWRELGEDVAQLALRLGLQGWVTLGAIPAAVPHTRATHVFATASAPGLLGEDVEQGPQGLLRVPSAALSAIELSVMTAGVSCVGFYAQVPHYVGGPFASASIALLEQVERHLGVEVGLGSLPEDALAQRGRLDAAVEGDAATKAYVDQLEAGLAEDRIPSGDDLGAEIERFLRDADGGEPGRPSA